MKITANKSVSAEYELFVDGENEGELELMEKATTQQPLSFIYGVGMMLPKFEEHLFGLATGDKFEFTLNVEDAYGEYEDANVIDLDRSIFEVDGKLDEKVIFAGNVVPLMDSEGNRLNAQVVEVSATAVKVDLNHPLAGETLHFKGSILEVHEATEEELNAIFGGGGGCGCGSGGCGCDDGHDHEHGKGGCGCH
ncbi:MAG: peptidylprolyl isomerase [Paludibacter sp. 47-17]|jgi:FKBP-type peptidyl-prolyl cis-trans isomerase SlyD|nr:MAG: peptidylprolyl isomerase [Paludibacter sp. SCN 50-10]OJX88504.1 MAG: peptidylprolyl isomerase [Paludibacter sp. 47-17]